MTTTEAPYTQIPVPHQVEAPTKFAELAGQLLGYTDEGTLTCAARTVGGMDLQARVQNVAADGWEWPDEDQTIEAGLPLEWDALPDDAPRWDPEALGACVQCGCGPMRHRSIHTNERVMRYSACPYCEHVTEPDYD